MIFESEVVLSSGWLELTCGVMGDILEVGKVECFGMVIAAVFQVNASECLLTR